MTVRSTKHWTRKMAQHPVIFFTNEDYVGINQNLDDHMVILVVAANFVIKKVLVNQGSLTDLLYLSTLTKLRIPEKYLKSFKGNMVNFSGEQVNVKGYIELLTTFRSDTL